MKKIIVYVPLAVDFLHEGHINILRIAKKYGDVIVGLLTDEAISNYKSIPLLDYKNRELLVKNLKYVSKVVPQKTEDYSNNLNKIKPNFFVHGDDWKYDNRKKTRAKVIKTLKKWSGKLIEPKYTKDISSFKIKKKILELASLPENRVSRLKRLLSSKKIVRILESHKFIDRSYH